MRADRIGQDQETRILRALRAGEMTTPELDARLRAKTLHALHRLEARGQVVCVLRQRGNVPAVWDLPRRLEQSA